MKSVKHILALVFGILGAVYLVMGVTLSSTIPSAPTDEALPIVSTVFTILGVVFLLAAVIVSYALNRRERQRRELMDYGIRVNATVIDVLANYSVRVNRRHPWVVVAECTHPLSHEKVQLRSHNLWTCTIATGQTVPIAFDQMNEKKYAFIIPDAEEKA